MTDAGALLGTPHYMAPEQWTGRSVDSRTDVYAMGATLHHLCTPASASLFTGSKPASDELCGAQHCNDPPPPLLSVLDPSIGEGVARAVARALSKDPEDRFADAAAMLRDLETLRLGKPTDLAIHPRLPAIEPGRILQFEFRWDLESSPRQLWPLVTNTDRLDRALGFMPVTYHTRYEPGRGVRTFAEGRKAGMPEIGEEYPYEWVEPRRMGILREYSAGPFKWLVSSVELLPRPGGGTTLIHSLRLEPSTWTVRVGSRWGVGVGDAQELPRESLSPHRCDDPESAGARHFPPRSIRLKSCAAAACRARWAPAVGPTDGPSGRARRRMWRSSTASGRAPLTDGSAQECRLASGSLALAGRILRARPRSGRHRLPARASAREGLLGAALGPALPGLPYLGSGEGHTSRHRRPRSLRRLPPRLRARLRQLDRAHLSSAPRDSRGRPGHLPCRRAGMHSPLHVAAQIRASRRRNASSWSSSCRKARTGCGDRSFPGRPTLSFKRRRPRGAGTSTSSPGQVPSDPRRCARAARYSSCITRVSTRF